MAMEFHDLGKGWWAAWERRIDGRRNLAVSNKMDTLVILEPESVERLREILRKVDALAD